MASIVQSIQRNTVTLVSGLAFQDVTISSVTTSRAEVILDCRTGQSTTNLTNMSVTAELTSATNVRLQRGGNTGAIVCHITIIEYTAASGVIVDRGTAILNAVPLNISITSRDYTKRYSRVYMRTSSNTNFATVMATHDVTSNTNLQIYGNGVDTSITFVWQTIYIPDATVHHLSGLATGTSYNVSLSGLGIVPDEAYTITSMRFGGTSGIDDDEFKGARITSSTNLNIYSNYGDSHYFVTQIVHRPANRVERNYSTFAATTFNVTWLTPVDWNSSFINLACPYGYWGPATYSNDAGNFMVNSQLNTNYAITLYKFAGVQTSYIVSEVVYIDGGSVTPIGVWKRKKIYRGVFRRNG